MTSSWKFNSIHAVFEGNAYQHPENIAIISDSQKLTYKELNCKANQLAYRLKKLCLPIESPVAILLPPGIDLIITLLGILKAGYAYVAIDPQHPGPRVQFVLKDCQTQTLITTQNCYSHTVEPQISVIYLDNFFSSLDEQEKINLNNSYDGSLLAYICYTSGSTGQPKGVMIEHKGITRLVKQTNYIQINAQDRIAQITNISFDVAMFEIWGALLNSATLICPPAKLLINPPAFGRFLEEQQITILWLTPRLLDQLLINVSPEIFSRLTYLLIGGETLNPQTIARIIHCPKGRPKYLLNGYGPTENSVFTTTYQIPDQFDGSTSVPIGKAISHTQIYILDNQQKTVASGTQGELYTGGPGVARGYLNRPELNKDRFIQNPLNPDDIQDRLYRTGDIVFERSDGNLDYIGRSDSQVKIRGFRLELNEIENCLLKFSAISQCVVLALPHSEYEKYLCAFLVAKPDQDLNIEALKIFMLETVPFYYLPENFIILDQLPLTTSGKIDQEALIKLTPEKSKTVKSCSDENDTVRKLTKIWCHLLNLDQVNLDADFSTLGGYSLLLLRLKNKIQHIFNQELTLEELLSANTVLKQAQCLDNKNQKSQNYLINLQASSQQTPLYLLPPVSGEYLCFLPLVRNLSREQAVYALREPDFTQNEYFHSLDELALFFLENIKKNQSSGPYRLAGYSFGAHAAMAIASHLIAQGETVEFLALLDGWAKFPAAYSEESAFRQRMQNLQQRLNASANFVEKAWRRMALLQNHVIHPVPVKIVLLKAQQTFLEDDPYNHWLPWAQQGIERYLIPGDHDSFLEEPQVKEVAKIFNRGGPT